MMIDIVVCETCGRECLIEGTYPYFTAFCQGCNDAPNGWDPVTYATQKVEGEIDTEFTFENIDGSKD